MRFLLICSAVLVLAGCTRAALHGQLDEAYLAYEQGDCGKAMLELSRAERNAHARTYLQPEISLLRGQCLERESLYLDAAETYRYIVGRFPASEYAFRARARLQTLDQLGLVRDSAAPKTYAVPAAAK
jgi:outer membrane protein assembly factor BamD (BamD/ComL family)